MTPKTSVEMAPVRGRNLWLNPSVKAVQTFRARWKGALYEGAENRQEMSKFDDFWQRQDALAQLRGPFWLLGFQTVQYLCAELAIYSRYLNRIVATNEALRSVAKAIADAHTAVIGVSEGTELTDSIHPFSQGLVELRRDFVQFGKGYWDDVFTQGKLKFNGKEYPPLPADPDWETKCEINPFLEIPKPVDLGLNRYQNMGNPPYSDRLTENRGIRFISDGLHLPTLKQERNLDTIFQVRVGDLLRSVAKRIRLTTISRLVLLVYICADLATDKAGRLIITESDPERNLDVDKTYETLRDAGLR